MTRSYTKRKGKDRPKCNKCNKSFGRVKGKYIDGTTKYGKECSFCHNIKYRYQFHKKDKCEDCGFIPKHKCQLDVDHIDGNHNNNNTNNLKTLCANCHRLKTFLKKEGWYSENGV